MHTYVREVVVLNMQEEREKANFNEYKLKPIKTLNPLITTLKKILQFIDDGGASVEISGS